MTYTSFKSELFIPQRAEKSIPIIPLTRAELPGWLSTQNDFVKSLVASQGFDAKAGGVLILPDFAILGMGDAWDFWVFGGLTQALRAGNYHIDAPHIHDLAQECLAFLLGGYEYARYKKGSLRHVTLACPMGVSYERCLSHAQALYLVRDLINTPAEDMGPGELVAAAHKIARDHKAKLDVITGEDLLDSNFPAVHRVGRASDREPRLIDLHWGDPKNPRVTLVGKGVCFDSGGLDIKPPSGMLLMKKDMGGAACVLGLAQMIMDARLPIYLHVIIPAVDNAIAGNAMRPKDIITMRSGKTVEIGDTDAEGRLILADALAYGAEGQPDLMIDMATLTGAARIALGPDLPNLFANQDAIADGILDLASGQEDFLWRMPLWAPYKKFLSCSIADLSSTSSSGYGGAITAALFLEHFVGNSPWVHIDLMAWNTKSAPGRPEGGEAMGVRALFAYLEKRYT